MGLDDWRDLADNRAVAVANEFEARAGALPAVTSE
jgi:hypothetical protein